MLLLVSKKWLCSLKRTNVSASRLAIFHLFILTKFLVNILNLITITNSDLSTNRQSNVRQTYIEWYINSLMHWSQNFVSSLFQISISFLIHFFTTTIFHIDAKILNNCDFFFNTGTIFISTGGATGLRYSNMQVLKSHF